MLTTLKLAQQPQEPLMLLTGGVQKDHSVIKAGDKDGDKTGGGKDIAVAVLLTHAIQIQCTSAVPVPREPSFVLHRQNAARDIRGAAAGAADIAA